MILCIRSSTINRWIIELHWFLLVSLHCRETVYILTIMNKLCYLRRYTRYFFEKKYTESLTNSLNRYFEILFVNIYTYFFIYYSLLGHSKSHTSFSLLYSESWLQILQFLYINHQNRMSSSEVVHARVNSIQFIHSANGGKHFTIW